MNLKLLIEKLEEVFKPKMYRKGLDIEDLAVSAGEQRVLNYMRQMSKDESSRLR